MKELVVRRHFIDFDKEERWLNQMAEKGMNLIHHTFPRYQFEQGVPGEYIYRIQLLPHSVTSPESREYIDFLESLNIEYMDNYANWVYLRKKASDGPFNLFSDSDFDSQIKRYRVMLPLYLLAGVASLFGFLIGIINGSTPFNIPYLTYIVSILDGCFSLVFTWVSISYIRKIRWLKKQKLLYE